MALVIGTVPPGFEDPANPEHSNSLVILLPPQNGGGMNWGQVWLSFGSDFGDSKLRLGVWNDVGKYWRVETVEVKANAGRANLWVQDGDSKVSVTRVKASASDTGRNPIGWMIESYVRA